VSAPFWIPGWLHITQFQVLFFLHAQSLLCCSAAQSEAVKIASAPHCGVNRSAVRRSSKVATATVTTPISSGIGSTSVIQMLVAGAVFTPALRIFNRLLIPKLQCFLFFWHCVVLCCLGLLFVLVGPA